MRLPIDTAGMTFLCAIAPAPVLDPQSRRQRADKRTGELQWAVQLVALTAEGAEILRVLIADECRGVVAGAPVRVSGLVANSWEMEDRHGISFRAVRIEPATSASGSSPAGAAGASRPDGPRAA